VHPLSTIKSKKYYWMYSKVQLREKKIWGIMFKSIQNTCTDRDQLSIQAKMSHKTAINKFINNRHLFRQQAEESTDARHIAVYDIYNTITFTAMNHIVVPQCKPELIINFDATQFQVGYDCDKMVEIICSDKNI